MPPLTLFNIGRVIDTYIRLSPDPFTSAHLNMHVPDDSRTFGNLRQWLSDRLSTDNHWIQSIDGSSQPIDFTPTATATDRNLPAIGSIAWFLTLGLRSDTITALIGDSTDVLTPYSPDQKHRSR